MILAGATVSGVFCAQLQTVRVKKCAELEASASMLNDHVSHRHESGEPAKEFAPNRRVVFGETENAVEQILLRGKGSGLGLRHQVRIGLM
jgi:hypothetical protein